MQENIENSQERHVGQSEAEPALDYATTPSMLHHVLSGMWSRQLEEDDVELLDVSLYHLFYNLNLLLQEILPQLAEISAQAEAAAQYMRARQMQRHQIWLWLSEMKHRLERIEPLCQIITITITHLLTVTESNEQDILQKSHQQRLFCQAQQREQQRRALTPQEQAYYAKCLCVWQELNVQPRKLQMFKHLFADLPEGHSLLIQMDSAFAQLYQNAQILFSALLQPGGSSSAGLLLIFLNLQQHADMLQMQIDTLLTPLYSLRKQTALLVELR